MPLSPPPLPRTREVNDAKRDWRLDALEANQKLLENKVDSLAAEMRVEFSHTRAQGSSETTKMIIGAVVAVITSIAGAFGVNELRKPPERPTASTSRSAFDRALDACRELPDPTKAGECISRVTVESIVGAKK